MVCEWPREIKNLVNGRTGMANYVSITDTLMSGSGKRGLVFFNQKNLLTGPILHNNEGIKKNKGNTHAYRTFH
jgi:hypothetical protein